MTNKINSITTHIETTKCIYIYIIYFCFRCKGKHIEVKMFLSDFVHRCANVYLGIIVPIPINYTSQRQKDAVPPVSRDL
jgi:hypothetical protein